MRVRSKWAKMSYAKYHGCAIEGLSLPLACGVAAGQNGRFVVVAINVDPNEPTPTVTLAWRC
jgi:hypothetical protein